MAHALPAPPSWYPGHMRAFTRALPALLARTDAVLELRDARLPLTSVNGAFEGALRKWRLERQSLAAALAGSSSSVSLRGNSSAASERIIVMNKCDLVPEWGIELFRDAMRARHPHEKVVFASTQRPRDVRALHDMLVRLAHAKARAFGELNVLVVGMPNVGKSTVLNALRNVGIPGRTPKALLTSAHPGRTRTLSTRLKLCADPPIYALDSPGVMLPFLGRGALGAERGAKLALIAGIREGLYDDEALAGYLLHQLNELNPTDPAYLSILPPGTPPTADLRALLDALAQRLGMLQRGGARDHARAAAWLVHWWRTAGCMRSASPAAPAVPAPPPAPGTAVRHAGAWGFDLRWDVWADAARAPRDVIAQAMRAALDAHAALLDAEAAGGGASATQERKREREAIRARSIARAGARLAARRIGMGTSGARV